MNEKVRIARELVRIAKSLIAGYKHEDETIGPFKMYVSNMTVGSMRYPGDFICVSGPYADMQFVKDQLKALGLRFDGMGKQWYVYWTKCDWNKIKNILEGYAKTKEIAAEESDLQQGDMFERDMTITKVGEIYRPDYFGSMELTQEQLYAIHHPDQYGKIPTIKRKVTFSDNETQNTYVSHISSRQRITQSDRLCRERFDDLDQCVGQKIRVVGEVTGVKSYPGKSEITFKMK